MVGWSLYWWSPLACIGGLFELVFGGLFKLVSVVHLILY